MIVLWCLQVSITPLPREYVVLDPAYVPVNRLEWSCVTSGVSCLMDLENMKWLFEKAFYPKGEPIPQTGAVQKLEVTVDQTKSCESFMSCDESYEIKVTEVIQITARTLFGVSRALSTVSQLITEAPGQEYVQGRYFIQKSQIKDKPVHKYRSLLIDAARHFLPLSTIKRQMDALAVSKLNVLHLHLIDSESSAFKPSTAPADAFFKAAFKNGDFYQLNLAQLKELIKYGKSIGVFTTLEMDMPGHAASWRLAHPEIVANCPNSGFSSVNPFVQKTYQVINAFLTDLVTAFTENALQPIIHLGGDELDHNCWNEDPTIQEEMQKQQITTNILWQQFHFNVSDLLYKLNPSTTKIYWQESFENGNHMKKSIVHSWNDESVTQKAVQKNVNVIRSYGWYLDLNQPGEKRYAFQMNYMDLYAVDILKDIEPQFQQFILGGGACMWGEKVHNGNIDEQIWPRALVISEVLWSNPADRTITNELKNRISDSICQLLNIGIQSGAIRPYKPCPGAPGARF